MLFEDATQYYNKWVAGIAGKEFGTARVKFKDIVGKAADNTDQSPNTTKAGNVLPYPLPSAVSVLGDLAINTTNALTMFRTALKNPAIKENVKARAEIITTINALKKSLDCLNEMFQTFQKNS